MNPKSLAFSFVSILVLSVTAQAATITLAPRAVYKTTRTSTGAEFRTGVFRVDGGKVTGTRAPNGDVWSAYQGDADELEGGASAICAAIGAELPSNEDYVNLRSSFELTPNGYFLSDRGVAELAQVFPDMRSGGRSTYGRGIARKFWTTTLLPNQFVLDLRGLFISGQGNFNFDTPENVYSVRCLWRATTGT